MNLTAEELQHLSNASTADEWNGICDAVKDKRHGQYPPDWFAKVLASGLAQKKSDEWAGAPTRLIKCMVVKTSKSN